MNIYDECLASSFELLSPFQKKTLKNDAKWEDAGKNQLIFKNDTAYELGGGLLSAISGIFCTESEKISDEDEVILVGNDLNDITKDIPYARLCIVKIDSDKMGEGEELYKKLRKIEYTRYHLNPKGYMMRVSAMTHRESVRVSKTALKEGLSFDKVGTMLNKAYHLNPEVISAHQIFITDPNFDYEALQKITDKSEKITKTLDHLADKLNMDCHSCNLKEICDEVEEKFQEDFNKDIKK